ncbi:6-phospho-3-hexuloisomerase [Halalkalibacterium ligniniphilum]|uniref:6-phospho-3-hexuloisomerase n=1 Tax=Halalkalibacterium ligniniphilum TaxID=1134413 RepID=UPI000347D1DE|nr:6-phospho-3-hexuloisomerase [Halalkalibacterium ligniniphilum]
MQTTDYLAEIIAELKRTADLLLNDEVEQLVDAILSAKKIFVAGAGRSGFMAKAFAMRMMHMGQDAYVIGETVTPGYEKEDLLILGSGSGETKSLVSLAEKAQSIGGKVAAVTIHPESTIGKLSDITVKIPAQAKSETNGAYKTIQPMGSLFEQSLLLIYDAIVLKLMEKQEQDGVKMYGKHANLE